MVTKKIKRQGRARKDRNKKKEGRKSTYGKEDDDMRIETGN